MTLRLSIIFTFLIITLTSTAKNIEVDTTDTVTIGGIEQFISVQGTDITNPLLLYLHGGPGESVMNKADQLTSDLRKHFVVVHWDQRGAGKTLELNPSPEKPTLQRMKKDVEEVVEYLLEKFNRDKLYLVGHSWGTVLGFHIAEQQPESLHALVAISPSVDAQVSQRIALDTLKNHFQAAGNQKAIQQLATVQVPYENLKQMVVQYRWQTEYDGEEVTDEQVEQAMPYLQAWEEKWGGIEDEMSQLNLAEELPSLDCPVYFLVGRNDMQTNYAITEQYYHQLEAPQKALFWFENSAHNVPDTESELMQQRIIQEILPKTGQ